MSGEASAISVVQLFYPVPVLGPGDVVSSFEECLGLVRRVGNEGRASSRGRAIIVGG